MRIVREAGSLARKRIDPAMARRFGIAFPVLLLFGYSGWAQAQAVPAKTESAADITWLRSASASPPSRSTGRGS
jgi:hypothetical protein